MALMCTGCFKQREFYEIKLEPTYHPYHVGDCDKCGGVVCEIDDLIVDTIIVLNKKGWTTKFCCSGHLNKNNGFVGTYIFFEKLPDTHPQGFYKDSRNCIRPVVRKNAFVGLEGYDTLVRLNRSMYEWALTLPSHPDRIKKVMVDVVERNHAGLKRLADS